MDLNTFREVHKDIIAALKEVGQKHNLTFEAAGGTYGTDADVFKIKAIANDESGKVRDLAREAFIKYAKLNYTGLDINWLDKAFTDRGRTYTVVGYAPRRKYPLVTKRDDGRTFNWHTEFVSKQFPKASVAA